MNEQMSEWVGQWVGFVRWYRERTWVFVIASGSVFEDVRDGSTYENVWRGCVRHM